LFNKQAAVVLSARTDPT